MMTSQLDSLLVGISHRTGTLSISSLGKKAIEEIQGLWQVSEGKKSACRIFYNVAGYRRLAVVSTDATEKADAQAQAVRMAASLGVRELQKAGANKIIVDGMGSPQSAAEGAFLSSFRFNMFRTHGERFYKPKLAIEPLEKSEGWQRGQIYAEAQNEARSLMETPANVLTPTKFVQRAEELAKDLKNLKLIVRDADWMKKQRMGGILGVAQGSDEPPRLLEVHYKGGKGDVIDLAYVGKGITFDSGGISLKPPAGMGAMRADMGGAATTLCAVLAAARLGVQKNISVILPLTENMPSGHATRPGDILTMRNGTTVEVDNTDAEGRLILADALHYCSSEMKPKKVVSVATLTGAMVISLGNLYTGAFVETDKFWDEIQKAGLTSGDKFWRLPLVKEFQELLTKGNADMANSVGREGGSCVAAGFLRMFVDGLPSSRLVHSEEEDTTENNCKTQIDFAHLDIAGVMDSSVLGGERGMSGRPTRSLINLIV